MGILVLSLAFTFPAIRPVMGDENSDQELYPVAESDDGWILVDGDGSEEAPLESSI
jgi:hypothetical protein